MALCLNNILILQNYLIYATKLSHALANEPDLFKNKLEDRIIIDVRQQMEQYVRDIIVLVSD